MINSKPAGLLSLLGVKGGDAPSMLSGELAFQLEALPFYLANFAKFDDSATTIVTNSDKVVIYPALEAVPDNSLRYIILASAMAQITAGVGAAYVQGWRVLRSNGNAAAISAVTYGGMRITNGVGYDFQPYSHIKDLILQPGDRLGLTVSSDNTITSQINFGIRYADFLL